MLIFCLQAAVIVAASLALGRLFRYLGQPQVVGEMIAGILLGPSLLGWLAPQVYQSLFPPASLEALDIAGQVGLALYMFLLGASLDFSDLLKNGATAVVTSISSIAVPFLMGIGLAMLLYSRLAMPGTSRNVFALFLGISLCITAFPVLARIMTELKLLSSRLGKIAISCAAIGDIVAWMLLALVLSMLHPPQHIHPVWRTVPFFAGLFVPGNFIVVRLLERYIQPILTVALLPIFFAHTGVRTQLGLLLDAQTLGYAAIILVAAVAGKWLGASIAARAMGVAGREANALGILMNTRGLVELVVLNIGYEAGLLSQRVFSILVAMAILTTLMTTPLLRLTYLRSTERPS